MKIARGGAIPALGSTRYCLSSQSVAGACCDVSFRRDGRGCLCPYATYGSRRCKHIRAVAGLEKGRC